MAVAGRNTHMEGVAESGATDSAGKRGISERWSWGERGAADEPVRCGIYVRGEGGSAASV